MPDIKSEFETALVEVKKLSKRPDNETLLKLYALFKQSTVGDVSGKRPGFTDLVGRAKYDAWAKLQGSSQEETMREYVDLVKSLEDSSVKSILVKDAFILIIASIVIFLFVGGCPMHKCIYCGDYYLGEGLYPNTCSINCKKGIK